MFAMGVTMYGQMTAGSYCYIGPQGIVHGTTVSVELTTNDSYDRDTALNSMRSEPR